jgi:hypothetical protein
MPSEALAQEGRSQDRWPSGLRHTLGKRAWCNSHRGFESRPVRQRRVFIAYMRGFLAFGEVPPHKLSHIVPDLLIWRPSRKRPDLTPAHHVERPTGIGPCGAMIETSRTKPVVGKVGLRIRPPSLFERSGLTGAVLSVAEFGFALTEFGFGLRVGWNHCSGRSAPGNRVRPIVMPASG